MELTLDCLVQATQTTELTGTSTAGNRKNNNDFDAYQIIDAEGMRGIILYL